LSDYQLCAYIKLQTQLQELLAEKPRRQWERSSCKARHLTCCKDVEAVCTGFSFGPQSIFHCRLERGASPQDLFLSALMCSLRSERAQRLKSTEPTGPFPLNSVLAALQLTLALPPLRSVSQRTSYITWHATELIFLRSR